MILIADSGATKTDWRLVYSRQDIRSFQTSGFNPFFIDSAHIEKEMEKDMVPFIDTKHVKEIFFYGAGCAAVEQCIIVEDALQSIFTSARIHVDHDLLGAARALCKNQEGIACILGTGSNSCFYDGKKITANVPSLGYLLGDEGSGAYIGKQLIKDVLSLNAPDDIRELFVKKYNYNRMDILGYIYRNTFPNRFLASFTRFVKENITHPYMHNIVRQAFSDFFDTQVIKYNRYQEVPVSFTGSVAYVFIDILQEVAAEKNITVSTVLQAPINGLVDYHLFDLEKFATNKLPTDNGD